MFGRPKPPEPTQPERPSAPDRAKIQGRGLVTVIVSSLEPLTFYLFLNDTPVPQDEVKSLFVGIEGPSEERPDGQVMASLSRTVTTVSGSTEVKEQELFPCTIVLVAAGRRLQITASQAGSLEGLWMRLGLRPDGDSFEISGAQKLQLVLQDPLLQAQLTWNDGTVEDIIPITS